MNQSVAKQALDSGVYGIIWPHVSTVDEARNAVARHAVIRGHHPRHVSKRRGCAEMRRGRQRVTGASRSDTRNVHAILEKDFDG